MLHRGVGKPTRCRSCKQEIVFAHHPASGKSHPFQRDDQGVWTIVNGEAKNVGAPIAAAAQLELLGPPAKTVAPEQRWTSHFANCRNAADWRGEK